MVSVPLRGYTYLNEIESLNDTDLSFRPLTGLYISKPYVPHPLQLEASRTVLRGKNQPGTFQLTKTS